MPPSELQPSSWASAGSRLWRQKQNPDSPPSGKSSKNGLRPRPRNGRPPVFRTIRWVAERRRSSVRGFLSSAKDRNYVQAAEYLDLRNLPPGLTESQGPELARQLRIVLDRTLWIDVELLSTNPEGEQSDNLPAVRERVGRIAAEGKTYDLLLQRVPRGDGVYIWKFADVTVADIPDLYQQVGYGQLERIFPAWMFDVSILGINLWLWAAVIGLAIVLYPVAMLVTKLATLRSSYLSRASCRSVRATVQRSDYSADLDSNGEKRRRPSWDRPSRSARLVKPGLFR